MANLILVCGGGLSVYSFRPKRSILFHLDIDDHGVRRRTLGRLAVWGDVDHYGAQEASVMSNFSRILFLAISTALFFDFCTALRETPLVPSEPSLLVDEPSGARRADGLAGLLMDVFQVSTPIAIPKDVPSQCQQLLMSYSFGNSYGKPFSGE